MELLESSPVIAAVKDEAGLKSCFTSDCQMVFVLNATILNVGKVVRQIKEHGKYAMVHADLTQGLGSKEIAVDFIKETTEADGIISTKPALVRRAMELGMYGVLRAFVIDTMALQNTLKQIEIFRPDMLEAMPGIMPKVLKEIQKNSDIPLIAGGLISEKKDIIAAFSAGADGVSTTKEELWFV